MNYRCVSYSKFKELLPYTRQLEKSQISSNRIFIWLLDINRYSWNLVHIFNRNFEVYLNLILSSMTTFLTVLSIGVTNMNHEPKRTKFSYVFVSSSIQFFSRYYWDLMFLRMWLWRFVFIRDVTLWRFVWSYKLSGGSNCILLHGTKQVLLFYPEWVQIRY
jgi:hypothetical protein